MWGLTAPADVAAEPEPTVVAASSEDQARAEGFLDAARRMEGMDLARRLWSGRLAEVFGPRVAGGLDAARLDWFVRIAGFRADAQQAWKSNPHPLLEAYAAGVNAWIDSGAWRGRPGFEQHNTRPRLWAPADSLVVVRAPQRAQGELPEPWQKLWASLQSTELRAPGAIGGGGGGWPSMLERPACGGTARLEPTTLLALDRCAHGKAWRKVAVDTEDLTVRGEPIRRILVRRAPAGGLLADLDADAPPDASPALAFDPASPPSTPWPALPVDHPARVVPDPRSVPAHRLVPLVGGA